MKQYVDRPSSEPACLDAVPTHRLPPIFLVPQTNREREHDSRII